MPPRKLRQRIPSYVYVLASRTRGKVRTYVGWTVDLDARVETHNSGRGAKNTRGQTWVLIYAERCKTRRAAMKREYALKNDRAFRALLRNGAADTLG